MPKTATPESTAVAPRGAWSPTNLALAALYGALLGLPWGALVASAQLTGNAAWQRRLPLLLALVFAAAPAFRRVRGRWLLLLFPVLFLVNVAVVYGTILVLRAAMGLP